MWAAGAAVLSCLAVAGLPAVGQSPAAPSVATPTDYAAVTGANDCSTSRTEGTESPESPPYGLTGQVQDCTYVLSDPRVSGPGTVEINVETWDPTVVTAYGTNMLLWGGQTIQGPEGTWSGRHYGFYDADGIVQDMSILAGSGAYDGWTFVFTTTVEPGNLIGKIAGVIHHSPPPPGFPVEPMPVSTR
jgi:hypothetical protein